MDRPPSQNLPPLLLEYLWRSLRLPRRAIYFLLYFYSVPDLEAQLRRRPKKILEKIPECWKKDVPPDPRPFGADLADFPFLTAADPDYPAVFHDLHDPPWVLYYQGKLSLLNHDGPRIAVVGTRRASDYAKRVTAQLVAGCKPYRPLILSGMAWGIDEVAHRSALQEGMATVGILGTPLHQKYAPVRQKLSEQMGKGALLLTELYPEATMGPWRFPERNRLLAALAQAIIVVEAPPRSGALITAQHGLELGREIFVVPGPIRPHFNAGGHRLIQDGAHLLTEAREIFQVLGYDLAPGAVAGGGGENNPGREADPLDGQILQILAAGPLHVDKIIAISQRPAPTVLARLIELGLAGTLIEGPGGYFEINK